MGEEATPSGAIREGEDDPISHEREGGRRPHGDPITTCMALRSASSEARGMRRGSPSVSPAADVGGIFRGMCSSVSSRQPPRTSLIAGVKAAGIRILLVFFFF